MFGRVESMDLETAEAKRQKMAPPAVEVAAAAGKVGGAKSSLDRNKSKSMMSVTGRTGAAAASLRGKN